MKLLYSEICCVILHFPYSSSDYFELRNHLFTSSPPFGCKVTFFDGVVTKGWFVCSRPFGFVFGFGFGFMMETRAFFYVSFVNAIYLFVCMTFEFLPMLKLRCKRERRAYFNLTLRSCFSLG